MIVTMNGHEFRYELEKLIRLFFPFEKISFINDENQIDGDFYVKTRLKQENDGFLLSALLYKDGAEYSHSEKIGQEPPAGQTVKNECERALAVALYRCLAELTGFRTGWGVLTGVRPAKLYRRIAAAMGENTDRFFTEKFLVSPDKLNLLKQTAQSEEKIIGLSGEKSVSIYLSVPFCPTRCSYCSFVSHSIEQAKSYIPKYVELLCREIEQTGNIIQKLGLKVETVYMGGGTPTTLSAEQMHTVLTAANRAFGGKYREFTVEAGRPDTITAEKLAAIKLCGADRISINPQTMNDEVLKIIGRNHNSDQTLQAFGLAREMGFRHINMDLIAGLPGDDLNSFKNTLEQVLALSPESVTVHALSFKRAADLHKNGSVSAAAAGASAMVDYALNTLKSAGLLPYYMYRQSKTVGNLENVGYSVAGKEGLYNVYIMDETHSIIACGASAVTKLKNPLTGDIERIFNYKYPYEYISGFDEMLQRKEKVEAFYREYFGTNQ